MRFQSGHESRSLESEEKERYDEDFLGLKNRLTRVTPGRWLFPVTFENFADKLYNFKYRSNDVVIMTWPKCGTTWTQEIVWTMRNNPDLNHPDAGLHVMVRAPFIDSDMLKPIKKTDNADPKNPVLIQFLKDCPGKDPADGMALQRAEVIPDPRTIKTHLAFSLMPPSLLDTAKVVYVARNPKDVIVSFHHHCRIIKGINFVGNFDEFVKYFLDDNLLYGPYWLHLKEAWERRNHPNLHFMFYEDMIANPLEEFKKLDLFLGTNLTESQLENIVKYTSFNEMKGRAERVLATSETAKAWEKLHKNVDIVEKDGGSFRKGETGDWKNKLTPAQDAAVDQWIQKNMASFGINFKYGK